jgi:hypothetical protein
VTGKIAPDAAAARRAERARGSHTGREAGTAASEDAVVILILLWLLGVPLGLIIILWLLGVGR